LQESTFAIIRAYNTYRSN